VAFGQAFFVAGGLVLPSTSNPAIDELLRFDPGSSLTLGLSGIT
jgi:hypothetical protein